jgi:hypothetical protein
LAEPRRWVLKDPNHLWGLEALLKVFPDACIIFTHRDLRTSMTSTASLVSQFRSLIEPGLTPEQQGHDVVSQWGFALDRAEQVRSRHDSARFFDVHIDQTRENPVGLVEAIYRHFRIPFAEETRAALERHAARDPRAGHAAHDYRPVHFGIDESAVRHHAGAYYERNRAVEERLARRPARQ